MKNIGYILIVICACSFSGLAQEDSLKEGTYSSVYSDPHNTDMHKKMMQRDYPKKYKDLIGKRLNYDFGEFGFEVIFKSDTLFYWKNLNTNYEETDISKTLQLDPYSVLTAWEELDGSFVSLYSNFKKNTASFFIRNKEGKYQGYSGDIKFK